MPSLRELQREIGRQLLAGGDADLPDWIAAGDLAPAERLDIYRDTVRGTLARALRLSFPAVQRLVGPEFFDAAAQAFARAHPPRSADLNRYGEAFPAFLQDFGPAAALAYLPDVARLEWAVTRALHAPEAAPLDLAALAAVAPSDHTRLRFTLHPALSLLRSPFPVDAIWRAVLAQDDAAMAAIDLATGPVALRVERAADTVEVVRLADDAWQFAAALLARQALGQALATIDPDRGPALLAEHLAARRLVAFELAPFTPSEKNAS